MDGSNNHAGNTDSHRTTIGINDDVSATPDSRAPRRRTFSLSDLAHSAPRTDEDIHRAIAQGRSAELKPSQV
jgi:hypothetical protein